MDKYFAHWEATSRAAFEVSFKAHLDEVVASDSRLDYAKSLRRLAASLNNAHTFFFDGWMQKQFGQPLGFALYRVEGEWLVISSQRAQLPVGSVVHKVGEQDIDDFYNELAPLISASSEQGRTTRLSGSAVLWPLEFSLTLGQGVSVTIDRSQAPVSNAAPAHPVATYHKVSSFSQLEHELAALAFFTANAEQPALVLDLRGNGGGSTPVRLIGALIAQWYWPKIAERAHRSGREAELSTATIREDLPSLAQFENTRVALRFKQPVLKRSTPVFAGELIVLIDRGCASACENLLLALKQRPRTTLVGECTFGSSGQPYFASVGTELVFAVGARREYRCDGRSLEGAGVEPDIQVALTAADLAAGRDAILEAAYRLRDAV